MSIIDERKAWKEHRKKLKQEAVEALKPKPSCPICKTYDVVRVGTTEVDTSRKKRKVLPTYNCNKCGHSGRADSFFPVRTLGSWMHEAGKKSDTYKDEEPIPTVGIVPMNGQNWKKIKSR